MILKKNGGIPFAFPPLILKSQKSVEGLISTDFCGFPLYQILCCDNIYICGHFSGFKSINFSC